MNDLTTEVKTFAKKLIYEIAVSKYVDMGISHKFKCNFTVQKNQSANNL